MSFNDPSFVQEFKGLVERFKLETILEVGCLSGELKDAVGADGIDINPIRDDVVKADIRKFRTSKRYDMVFSSGLIEHYDRKEAVKILKAMAKFSKKYVLTYVPNTNCEAYMKAKAKTKAPWKSEIDFTEDTLAQLHKEAGLEIVGSGCAGAEWAKKFGKEQSNPYLVWILAKKKVS